MIGSAAAAPGGKDWGKGLAVGGGELGGLIAMKEALGGDFGVNGADEYGSLLGGEAGSILRIGSGATPDDAFVGVGSSGSGTSGGPVSGGLNGGDSKTGLFGVGRSGRRIISLMKSISGKENSRSRGV